MCSFSMPFTDLHALAAQTALGRREVALPTSLASSIRVPAILNSRMAAHSSRWTSIARTVAVATLRGTPLGLEDAQFHFGPFVFVIEHTFFGEHCAETRGCLLPKLVPSKGSCTFAASPKALFKDKSGCRVRLVLCQCRHGSRKHLPCGLRSKAVSKSVFFSASSSDKGIQLAICSTAAIYD